MFTHPLFNFYNPPLFYYFYPCLQSNTTQHTPLHQNIQSQFQNLEENKSINLAISTIQEKQQNTIQTLEEDEAISPLKSNKTKKIRKISIRLIDDQSSQFNPRKLNQITPKKKWKGKQNQNRNVIPNIIHQAFSYLAKKKKSEKLLMKLFCSDLPPHNANFGRFYLYQKVIKEKMNHYLSEDSILLFKNPIEITYEIYSKQEQIYYMKICRIMILYFLNHVCHLVTLTSKRMSKGKRQEHLKARRYLLMKTQQAFK